MTDQLFPPAPRPAPSIPQIPPGIREYIEVQAGIEDARQDFQAAMEPLGGGLLLIVLAAAVAFGAAALLGRAPGRTLHRLSLSEAGVTGSRLLGFRSPPRRTRQRSRR